MRIAQISDTHISRDHPARTGDLKRCIAQVNGLDPQPDLVVHTGDISHNGDPEEYTTARGLLDKLRAPYLVLAGNRDNRMALLKAFGDTGYLRPDVPFVQYAVDQYPVRLICVDTLSKTSNKGHVCRDRLDDLALLLGSDVTRPAAIFMHHPPFDVDVAPDPAQFENQDNMEAFCNLIAQHRQVAGLFCGHVHRDVKGGAGTDTHSVKVLVMTCCAIDLRKGEERPATGATRLFALHNIE